MARVPIAAALALIACSCSTLGELAAARRLDFALDRVTGARLAGIDLGRIRDWRDLSAADGMVLVQTAAAGDLPLSLTLHVSARNPEADPARLLALEWTMLIDGRQTVSGELDHEVRIPAGETVGIPLPIDLDLARFFDGNARDLIDIAIAAVGGGRADRIALRARPVLETPLGPVSPGSITISPGPLRPSP